MFETNEIQIRLYENKHRISLRYTGEGPTILFVHGWNHSAAIWAEVMRKLVNCYKTVAVDLPGFGNSPPLPKDLIKIDCYSYLLHLLINKLSHEQRPFMLVGDSLGAIAIFRLLNQHGKVVDKIVLSGCPIDGLPPSIRFLKTKGLLSFSMRTIQSIPWLFSYNIVKLLSLATINNIKSINDTVIQGTLEADPDTAELLYQQLCLPMNEIGEKFDPSIKSVIIRGEYDHIVTRETSKRLAESFGGEYIEIPNVSHTPMVEDASGYVEAFSSLLK